MGKKVLVAATNYGTWGEELQAPWDALKKAGHQLTLITPKGKKPLPLAVSVDPDFVDPVINAHTNPPEVCERIKELTDGDEWAYPKTFQEVNMKDYDAIVLTGGLGAMFDMANNYNLHKLIMDAYHSGKLIGGLCYAIATLCFCRDSFNGNKSIVYGHKIVCHPHAWDFYGPDYDFTFDLYGETDGLCICRVKANRNDPEAYYDGTFVTASSVESSIAYGDLLVKVLAER